MEYTIFPLGDSAALIDFQIGDEETLLQTISSLTDIIHHKQNELFIEAVPAYRTVTVHYNPLKIKSHSPFKVVEKVLTELINNLEIDMEYSYDNITTIPIYYGGESGPDLAAVAKRNDMSEEKVIELHSNPLYKVAFLGFTPGFPFLKGMDPSIAAPRRSTPRVRIAAGSVGIAGNQTGVYPIASPGGWQIIGRTPLKIFDPEKSDPAFLSQGDQIKFKSITKAEYDRLEEH